MRTLTALGGLLLAVLLCTGFPLVPTAARAGTAVRMDVPDLVERSEVILEARVIGARALEVGTRIETEYLLAVERTFEGEDIAYRFVRFPGGVLEDGRGMILAGMPSIVEGEHVLLFLSERVPRGIRMPVGLSQGKYRVVVREDGVKELVQALSGVSLADPRTGELVPGEGRRVRAYADVVAEIEAALTKKRAR